MNQDFNKWDGWDLTPVSAGGQGQCPDHSTFGDDRLDWSMTVLDGFSEPAPLNQLDQPRNNDDWDTWDTSDTCDTQDVVSRSMPDDFGCGESTKVPETSVADGFDSPLPVDQVDQPNKWEVWNTWDMSTGAMSASHSLCERDIKKLLEKLRAEQEEEDRRWQWDRRNWWGRGGWKHDDWSHAQVDQSQNSWAAWGDAGESWETTPRMMPSGRGDDSYDSGCGDDCCESGCGASDSDSESKAPEVSDKPPLQTQLDQCGSEAAGTPQRSARSQRAAPRMRGSVAKDAMTPQPPRRSITPTITYIRLNGAAPSDLHAAPAARIRTPRGSVSRCAAWQSAPERQSQSCSEATASSCLKGLAEDVHRQSVLVVGDSGLGLRRAKHGNSDFKKELQAKLVDMDVNIVRLAGAGVRSITQCVHRQKHFGIVIAVWFLNEFFEKNNRLVTTYPPLVDELAGELAAVLRKIPRCAAVIGGSAQLWGVDIRFDKWAQHVRDIFSSAGIFVVDGVELFCRIDEAGGRKDEWHARNSDSNKECMATYFADLVKRILAK